MHNYTLPLQSQTKNRESGGIEEGPYPDMELTIAQIRMKADIIKTYKTTDELVPGDFVYLICSGLKNDGGIPDAMF